MKRYTLAAVAALLVLAPWHGTVRATAPVYAVQDLGNFGGLVPMITGINASGQVVGNADGSQAVRYTDGLGWEALPGLETGFSVATGINAAGDVVGFHFTATNDLRAFRYNNGTHVLDDIAPLSGGSFTAAFAINDAGTVVGYGDSSAGIVAFRADPGQPAVALPSLNGGFALACGINAAGQISGYSLTPSGVQHGMRLDPGAASPVDIQSLDGPGGAVTVCAIDAAGRVGGQADHAGQVHAFRYSDGGSLDLDTFGSSTSNVESMAGGVSVGWYTLADSSQRAFAHNDADGSFDLNTQISDAAWVLATAKAVNAGGVIAGEGYLNGVAAVYRLTPAASDTTAPVISSVTATPSLIAPPNGLMVDVSVSVSASDDSGDAPACSLESISGPAAAAVTGPFTGSVSAVAGSVYTLTVVCADAAGNTSHAMVDVTVVNDTTAPVISSVSASPSTISPADGRTVAVSVSVSATDDSGAAPSCSVSGVTGGEASVTGPLSVTVKATSGASYTVSVSCSDAAGNTSNGATAVSVVTAPPPSHDTKPPVIRFLYAQRTETRINGVPWEHVRLFVFATDNVDHSPFCSITSITGGPAGSFAITGRLTAKLREQRSAGDLNRVYVLNVSCVDDDGNAARATVSIDPNGRTVYSGDRRHWRW